MSRWIVHARTAFTASHALGSYRGRPEPRHSHRWEAAVRVGVSALGEEGYALDFHAVRAALEETVAPLDGTDLGEHPAIGTTAPSAESLAMHLADVLAPRYRAMGGTLLSVSVWEGPDNRVDLVLEEEGDRMW